jgi:hypothetical protein
MVEGTLSTDIIERRKCWYDFLNLYRFQSLVVNMDVTFEMVCVVLRFIKLNMTLHRLK